MNPNSKIVRGGAGGMIILALFLVMGALPVVADLDFGPTGAETGLSNPDGGWFNLYGSAYVATFFDPTNPPPAGDTLGSVYNQGDWTGDTGVDGLDDYNVISPDASYPGAFFDGTQFSSLELDVKYDTNHSTMTPVTAPHLDIGFDTGYNLVPLTNISFDSLTSPVADGQWHHLSILIPAGISGVEAADGVAYYQWNPAGTSGTMDYWLANVQLIARTGPAAPPTLTPPIPAIPGLNVFASTSYNSFYDRQEIELQQDAGLSWVGHATASHPVTYSFTINGFPSDPSTYDCEAYFFLVPNPAQVDNAPDYDETNCAAAFIQEDGNGATLYFQYKVNDPNDFGMYGGGNNTVATAALTNNYFYTAAPGSLPNGPVTNLVSPGVFNITAEEGALASVTTASALGTWTIRFTSDTNGTLIGPNGALTNFIFPAYNAAYFAERADPGCNVYLGMQANTAGALNQSVDYANISISNTAAPFSENFLTDTALDTTNTWDTSVASGPQGILIVPATAADWIQWTLPDSGFSLQTGASLASFSDWTTPSLYAPIPLCSLRAQLVDGTELPPGNTAFFNLVNSSSPPAVPTPRVGQASCLSSERPARAVSSQDSPTK